MKGGSGIECQSFIGGIIGASLFGDCTNEVSTSKDATLLPLFT